MSRPKGGEGASDYCRVGYNMFKAKYLRLVFLIRNVQLEQFIADYSCASHTVLAD
jgi:hypothetical protein